MSGAANWSHGYVTDVLYTDNSYRELSPAWINYVAALNGCQPRSLENSFTYVELGCGLGRSVTHLAAAFPRAQFVGVDFNPAHIDSAQRYADMLGVANVRFLEQGFEDLVGEENGRRLDLPQADFISLHGVYSWIGAAARQAVQRFIYERLKPGGFVYNSYNCLPGWAAEAPLRRLMVELGKGRAGSSSVQLGHALAQMGELGKFDMGYLGRTPAAKRSLEQYHNRPANYLVHEMLNADWNLFYSADVADEMAAAKLDFLGSATLAENRLELLVPEKAAAFISSQPDGRLRQLIQDFLINQRFRRDVFVRGHARLSEADTRHNLEAQIVLALKPLVGMEPKIRLPRGSASMDQDFLNSLGEILRKGSLSLADLGRQTIKGTKIDDFLRLTAILMAGNVLAPAVQAYKVPKEFDGRSRLRLVGSANHALLRLAAARESAMVKTRPLISSTYGGVIPIGMVNAVILTALCEGGGAETAVPKAKALLDQYGLGLRKDDQPVKEPEEKHAYLMEITQGFIDQELPVLMAAGIVEAA